MKTVHYSVEGMAGLDSKSKIKNSLDKVEGVQMVAVDLSRGTVEVQYNEPATVDKIKGTIERIGYQIL